MTRPRLALAAACLGALLAVPLSASGFGGGDTLCKKLCSHSLLSSLNKSNTVQCWIDCREKIESDARTVADELCGRRYTTGAERGACRAAVEGFRNYLVDGELDPAAQQ